MGLKAVGSIMRQISEVLGVNSLTTNMNADESVARGTALQGAILFPRFKVLPYETQELQPFPIKLSWDEDPIIQLCCHV